MHFRKEAIQELVNQLFHQEHNKKLLMLLRIINRLVSNRIFEARHVSEFMLNNLAYSSGVIMPSSDGGSGPDKHQQNRVVVVKATNTFMWLKVLEAVKNFIPQHDYKSCRDILKMLLEVIKRIPHSESSFPDPLETELSLSKSPKKRKLDQNEQNNDSYDDIKLESLYEV